MNDCFDSQLLRVIKARIKRDKLPTIRKEYMLHIALVTSYKLFATVYAVECIETNS